MALKAAREKNILWTLEPNQIDSALTQQLFPKADQDSSHSNKHMLDYERLRVGVNKKLLRTEYLEECRLADDESLMYSQFCYYIRQKTITAVRKISVSTLSTKKWPSIITLPLSLCVSVPRKTNPLQKAV